MNQDNLLPYLERELAAVAANHGVEEPLRKQMFEHVASAGRQFIADKKSEKKPSAGKEIANIAAAIDNALAVIQEASEDASFFLLTSTGHGEKPFPLCELKQTLERFQEVNRSALDSPPHDPKGGPAVDVAERKLITQLRNAFIFAHPGAKPLKGWPAFRAACLLPLEARHDLLHRSEKTWDYLLKTCDLTRPFRRLEKRRKGSEAGDLKNSAKNA
jgi:hypothetical protein